MVQYSRTTPPCFDKKYIYPLSSEVPLAEISYNLINLNDINTDLEILAVCFDRMNCLCYKHKRV